MIASGGVVCRFEWCAGFSAARGICIDRVGFSVGEGGWRGGGWVFCDVDPWGWFVLSRDGEFVGGAGVGLSGAVGEVAVLGEVEVDDVSRGRDCFHGFAAFFVAEVAGAAHDALLEERGAARGDLHLRAVV